MSEKERERDKLKIVRQQSERVKERIVVIRRKNETKRERKIRKNAREREMEPSLLIGLK